MFIVGLEETVFPTSRAVGSGDIEEERRLMYVAITRAKERLFVSWAKLRNRFGDFSYNPVSRFIGEMKDSETAQTSTTKYGFGAKNYDTDENIVVPRANAENYRSTFNASQKIASKSNADYSKFKVNAIVTHKRYGKGVITAVEGSGDDTVLSIMFKGLGIKRFALSIAVNWLTLDED